MIARLIINAIGSVCIVVLCLGYGISELHDLASGSIAMSGDPDRDKGVYIHLFGIGVASLLGLIASIALVRTVRSWRALHRD